MIPLQFAPAGGWPFCARWNAASCCRSAFTSLSIVSDSPSSPAMPRPYAVLMSSDGPLVGGQGHPGLAENLYALGPLPRLRQNREVWNTRITSISPRAAAAITAS